MNGLTDGTPLFVTGYPTAWRIENVDDVMYRGFEYVRSGTIVARMQEQPADALYSDFTGAPRRRLGTYRGFIKTTAQK